MTKFSLKDSGEYYLALSEQPKRFDADSPVTNVFFDDTNGEVSLQLCNTKALQILAKYCIYVYI